MLVPCCEIVYGKEASPNVYLFVSGPNQVHVDPMCLQSMGTMFPLLFSVVLFCFVFSFNVLLQLEKEQINIWIWR